MYMRDILRWGAGDPLADKYFSSSPYVYVLNNFVNAVDPDGKRVFFVAGAGNDQGGWNYVERWGQAFQQSGISGFTRLNVSHDNPEDLRGGGKPWGDMSFTSSFRGSRNTTYQDANTNIVKTRRLKDKMVSKAVADINQNLEDNPLAEGEQLNLAGYSYGSVVQAHAALSLADQGKKIDNLILIGSPISSDSDLYSELSNHENIGNVIRVDIDEDFLSDPQGMDFLRGVLQNLGIDGAHFDMARPGKEADKKIKKTTDDLKKEGVN
jgi:pimeloyl-ACP methyl ester carboxylesterase